MTELKEKIKKPKPTKFTVKFNVLAQDGTIRPKTVKICLHGMEPLDIKGLPPKAWFQSMLGNKLVVNVTETPKLDHLRPHFEFMEAERTNLPYVMDVLFKVLTEILEIKLEKFVYETI